MNTALSHPSSQAATEDRFGRRVAARLSAGNLELPHEVVERLRVARTKAVAERKVIRQFGAEPVVVSAGRTAALGAGWWTRIGSVAPLVALVAGLVAISVMQEDSRTNELAEIDSALLTDDLPPAAYTDPGFAQFLKAAATTSEPSER